MRKIFRFVIISSGLSFTFFLAGAQTKDGLLDPKKAPDTLTSADLQTCVQYALKHYPLIQQALLDEQITDRQIRSRLADWYPQLNLTANYQNNFVLQQAVFAGGFTKTGVYNNSYINLGLSQTLFNRDVLLAARTRGDVMTNIRQTTVTDKIEIAVNVTKAFYNVLLTSKQIEVLDDDIRRLERNFKDTYRQYQGGLVDKTDYKRATITLNNSKAERKTNEEGLKANYAALRQLMGYSGKDSIHLIYDSVKMEADVLIDTLAQVDYTKRIEYQQLMTQKHLQEADVKYNKWAYIPTLTANAGYNFNYLNNQFSKLYENNLPFSYAGVTLGFPIFQGTKRTQNIRAAELQLTRIDWDLVNLQNVISTQYAQAMAAYKSNLNNYYVLRENLALARDVYNTIELQYRSGVKAYLELITAETDLRNAQSNYSDALYQALSSKVDVQKALGTVQY
jgi:outer membrane protein TolC